jgi:hypothetical protein
MNVRFGPNRHIGWGCQNYIFIEFVMGDFFYGHLWDTTKKEKKNK